MVLHCTSDFNELRKISEKWVLENKMGRRLLFPVFQCPLCARTFTKLYPYPDSVKIKLDGIEYINILPKADEVRYEKFLRHGQKAVRGSRCYVYDGDLPGTCYRCGKTSFMDTSVNIGNGKKKKRIFLIICNNCKCYYVKLSEYRRKPSYWAPYNDVDSLKINEKTKKRNGKGITDIKKEWIENTKLLLRSEELDKENVKKREEECRKNEKEAVKAERMRERLKEDSLSHPVEKVGEERKQNSVELKQKQCLPQKRNQKIRPNRNNIEAKDFVVRRSAFKCRYKEHSLQNIEGLIQIIDRKGNVCQVRVPAGYCANCDTFFIMESVYQSLKLKGIPVCRVSDEKAYLSGNMFANGMQLAQESVLMQYGYSVSQEEGLTNAARRKILALIVDHKILTKNEIIGYLDFFISQRKNQSRYERAIDKWKQDREFISEYRTGEFEQYGVNGLFRKY